MEADAELIEALEAAIASDPSQLGLRVQLARLYLTANRLAAARAHLSAVLAAEPANRNALELSARAAEEMGEGATAEGYRRLLEGLGEADPGQRAERATQPQAGEGKGEDSFGTARSPSPAADENIVDEASLDAFLREVLEEPRLSGVTLADVGGLADVKKQLTASFLAPLRNPALRRAYGATVRGGLLLYGPPGCGKTFIARAIAGELGARFIGIGLHDVLEMWFGQSERNLHQIFETARRKSPSVLFIDEVDALGMKRGNLSTSPGRNVVVQFLAELDGVFTNNEGIYILGATNQPWDIDPALRRPGRFDRMVLVLPPDEPARREILKYHLKDRPVEDAVDFERLARSTDGYSGADLRMVCQAATEAALEESVSLGYPRPIGMGDLARAVNTVRPSSRPWFETAKNYALFANQDGVYDQLLTYMRRHRLV